MNDKNLSKQPSEIERVGVSFRMRLLTGEAVASAAYTITDPDGADVTTAMKVTSSEQISDQDADGVNESASLRVQAGDDGKDYKLTIRATTTLGNILEEDRVIVVREK